MAEESNDRRFWIGQNWWVVLGGAGIFLLPEHRLYGSICTVLGLLGFISSIRSYSAMKTTYQNFLWVAALLATWLGIGYDYYDRHDVSRWPVVVTKVDNLVRAESFSNQAVELDGRQFEDCIFTNVTFVFRANKPFRITHNKIDVGGHPLQLQVVQGPALQAAIQIG